MIFNYLTSNKLNLSNIMVLWKRCLYELHAMKLNKLWDDFKSYDSLGIGSTFKISE